MFSVVLHRDTTDPLANPVTGVRSTLTNGSLSFNASEIGTYRYVVVESGAPRPGEAAIKASSDTGAVVEGENNILLTTLSGVGAKDVYLMLQDEEGLWSEVYVVTLAAVHQLTVVSADTSKGTVNGSAPIGLHAIADGYYPVGTRINIFGEPISGFGLEFWSSLNSVGTIEGPTIADTYYVMPDSDATVTATFAPNFEYKSAVQVDGTVDVKTTTEILLSFERGGNLEDINGLDSGGNNLSVSDITLSCGLTVLSVSHTGTGQYTVTVGNVTSEDSAVTVQVRKSGTAIVPSTQTAGVHYDSTPPTLTTPTSTRTNLTLASAEFTSGDLGSDTGTYKYLVKLTTDTPPTYAELRASALSGSRVNGQNNIALDSSLIPDYNRYTVYVVACDAGGNWTSDANILEIPVEAYPPLAVSAGTGGTTTPSGGAVNHAEGDVVQISAVADKGYSFDKWMLLSGTGIIDDENATDTTYTMSETAASVRADFVKKDLTVHFDVNAPGGASVADIPDGSTKIGEIISGSANPVEPTAYSFIGWYTAAHLLDADVPAAWNFVTDLTTESMISGASSDEVTLYAAWSTNSFNLAYNLHDSVAHPANLSAFPTESVVYGSVISGASHYAVPVRGGYTFDGWHLDEAYATPVGVATMPAAHTGIHAKWLPNSYTISYAGVEGADNSMNTVTSYTVDDGTLPLSLKAPSKAGYDFTGWSVVAAGDYGNVTLGGADKNAIQYGVYGNLTATANWTKLAEPPVVEPPVVNPPIVDPIIDPPVVEPPVVGPPSVDPPVVNPPVVDTPVVDSPVVDSPATDTPIIDSPENNTDVIPNPGTQVNPEQNIKAVPRVDILNAARDAGIPVLGFGNNGVPLFGPSGFNTWALLDGILGIITVIMSAFAVFFAIKRRIEGAQGVYEDPNDESVKIRKLHQRIALACAVALAITSIVIFMLTQDVSLQMVLVDTWTIVFAVILAAECIAVRLAGEKRKQKNQMVPA
jgi:uncharacterized repeat protein (TIGR02543 family)